MFRSSGGVGEGTNSPTVTKEASEGKGSDASKESGKEGEEIELEGEMISVAVLLSNDGLERPPLVGGSSDGSGSGSSEASNPPPTSS